MTREENIRAILECNFSGTKEELIDIAVKNIMALSQEPCESIHGSTYGGVSWGGIYKPQDPYEPQESEE